MTLRHDGLLGASGCLRPGVRRSGPSPSSDPRLADIWLRRCRCLGCTGRPIGCGFRRSDAFICFLRGRRIAEPVRSGLDTQVVRRPTMKPVEVRIFGARSWRNAIVRRTRRCGRQRTIRKPHGKSLGVCRQSAASARTRRLLRRAPGVTPRNCCITLVTWL